MWANKVGNAKMQALEPRTSVCIPGDRTQGTRRLSGALPAGRAILRTCNCLCLAWQQFRGLSAGFYR